MSTMNAPLAKPLRSQLENTVKAARDVAEKAAQAALAQLAVSEARAPDYLSDDHKALRRRLRAHGRALGDVKFADDTQQTRQLVWEVAYEHWHRMLFARFLAESGLLMWEPGAPVSLDDCRDMVDSHPDLAMGAKSHWELAGKLAAKMLPQVFKPNSPVFELAFAPEHQRELEKLLANLQSEVFQASDSLGWVYQFWQAKRKDEVNASEVKIGADELPAVTQLFTEPYMVDSLLHNSLGAWWMTRHTGQPCPAPLPYLRTLEDGSPAAGTFEGWPNTLSDFKLLDPSCGSGHFLVAAFLLLVPMRMADEGLSAASAVDAVLAHNLHGLEIDPRCVEIAVFALALAAWRFRDENGNPLGVRAEMPAPNIACCGLKVSASAKDWEALVPETHPHAALVRQELRLLHTSFAQAPLLGSLLDPSRTLKNDLAASSGFESLRTLLEQALSSEGWGNDAERSDDTWDLALTARGLLDTALLLDSQYHLVITNVPYLLRRKKAEALKRYCGDHYPEARHDLATVMIERCIELSLKGGHGVVQVVTPQNWLFLVQFSSFRKKLLTTATWKMITRLGTGAFETISGEVVNVALLTLTASTPSNSDVMSGIDASSEDSALNKSISLCCSEIFQVHQEEILKNTDSVVTFETLESGSLLSNYVTALHGLSTTDSLRFTFSFWEVINRNNTWEFQIGTMKESEHFGGRSYILRWEKGAGAINALRGKAPIVITGLDAWGRKAVAVSQMGALASTLYNGDTFLDGTGILLPKNEKDLAAIFSYCNSNEYRQNIRRIDKSIKITYSTLAKVPFDQARWQKVAAEQFPNGLPKPYSDDPTQWLFHGHPQPSTDPLQVAVARLLGYTWPAESDTEMELSDEAHTWLARCAALSGHVDDDGIVCLPAVRGEKPAHERLLNLLISAWDTVSSQSWKPNILDKLLADADCAGKGLDVWLRDMFFEQHAKRFQHRPFIWHVWDGLKDGFSALVNYHKLDAKNLERLIHTYLGDWIRQQEASARDGIDGAQTRLVAAQDLKRRLECILEGEAPYDIFVRWKSLAEQPIGWNPDLNDGVRLNARPFMTAEVLRINKKPKLNIKWDKDRGKDVISAPWFPVFKGERINDHHLTLAEKLAALKE